MHWGVVGKNVLQGPRVEGGKGEAEEANYGVLIAKVNLEEDLMEDKKKSKLRKASNNQKEKGKEQKKREREVREQQKLAEEGG